MVRGLQSARLRHVQAIHAREAVPVSHVVAATAIQQAHKLMSDAQTAALSRLRLTRPRYEVLNVLYFSPTGTMGPAELSRVILLHPASMTYTADTLEQQGLVVRVPDDGDGRVLALRITDKGRRLVAKAMAALGEIKFGLPDLTKAQADQLSLLLSMIRHPDHDVGEPSVNRMPTGGTRKQRAAAAGTTSRAPKKAST